MVRFLFRGSLSFSPMGCDECLSQSWQVPHRVTMSPFTSWSGMSEECGSWQAVQLPSLTGACFFGDTCARLIVSAWQVPQTVTGSALSSPATLDACGLWQERQDAPSSSARCTRAFSRNWPSFWAWQPRHRFMPCARVRSGLAEPAGSWHCEHIALATGGWTRLYSMPRLSEPCGSWQLVQRAFATGYPWCLLANRGLSVLWQPTHRPGTSLERRLDAFAEPCGSWHATHPRCSMGLCFTFALAAASAMPLWQLAHRSLPPLTRLNLKADACGSWQPVQPFSASGLCVLRAFAGTMSWQEAHALLASPASSLPWSDACGLWQPVHSRDRTGVWTNGLFRMSSS